MTGSGDVSEREAVPGGAGSAGQAAPAVQGTDRSRPRVWPGLPYPLGATWDGKGVNVAVFSLNAERIELCLFDAIGVRDEHFPRDLTAAYLEQRFANARIFDDALEYSRRRGDYPRDQSQDPAWSACSAS